MKGMEVMSDSVQQIKDIVQARQFKTNQGNLLSHMIIIRNWHLEEAQ